MELPFTSMSLSAIIDGCAESVEYFHRNLLSDERYCLEIFRRALMNDDNNAWSALQEQFSGYLLYWFRCDKLRMSALQLDSEESYVNDTFNHLWRWGYRQRTGTTTLEDGSYQVEFTSLGSAHTFLKKSLHNLMIDKLRSNDRKHTIPLEEHDPPSSFSHDERLLKQELWKAVETIVTDERELLVIILRYKQGLTPREIIKRCPGVFKNVNEIYRLGRNALDRIKRNEGLFRYKIDWEE